MQLFTHTPWPIQLLLLGLLLSLVVWLALCLRLYHEPADKPVSVRTGLVFVALSALIVGNVLLLRNAEWTPDSTAFEFVIV
jgi:hypothetical protein